MSVRVVARIRPCATAEREEDVIVEPEAAAPSDTTNVVRIPNPKNAAESFKFNFNRVYDQHSSQKDLFDNEGR